MTPRPAAHRREHVAVMGTVASLHLYDAIAGSSASAAIAAVFTELQRLERMFSTFDPQSQISRINRGELAIADADTEVADVLDACHRLERMSNGAFCIYRSAPETTSKDTSIDPAGFVKGWAAEYATRLLDDHGCRNWYLNVGGDILVAGLPPGEREWKVAIVDPFDSNATTATLTIAAGAVATSGTSQRGKHLWRGTDGAAAPDDFLSVTVVGPTLAWADALATTMFAMGNDGLAWLDAVDGYDAFTIAADGTMRSTSGLGDIEKTPAPTVSGPERI